MFINPIIYKIKPRLKTLMLQIQTLNSTISYSNIVTDKKIYSSIGTEDTNEDTFKKKISLGSCSSSISLEENLQYSKEKQIFARFLFETNKQKSQKIFKETTLIYQSFHLQQNSQKLYVVDISESQTDKEGKVLTYFIDIWLRHMGYGTKKNRSKLLAKVKLFFGNDALKPFNRLYENFNLIPLSKNEKKNFLLKTCRNGWEFFIQELSKHAEQIKLRL